MIKKVKNKINIGLFGGTFNPIHHGHLKMAEAARKEYKLDIVYFIPCGVPPHKQKKDLLPAKKRLELVKKAIKGKKYFQILDIEIKKKKPCYTIDTVHELLVGIGRDQSLQLYFLLGQDEFEQLHTWDKANQLAKLITFLVLPRSLEKRKGKPMCLPVGARPVCLPVGARPVCLPVGARPVCLPKVRNLKWSLVHTKPINISSTEIRDSFKKSKTQ